MKNKYDSSVVYLYATGNEALLPKEFRKQIPYTTIATWRKTDYSSYIGNEFRYFFDEAFEGAEAKFKYRQLKQTMFSFARSWVMLSSAIKPVLKNAKKDKNLQIGLPTIKIFQKPVKASLLQVFCFRKFYKNSAFVTFWFTMAPKLQEREGLQVKQE